MKRSNPFAGEFSPTALEEYLACPRKYYISKILSLAGRIGNAHLIFGQAIHAGVAAFYKTKQESKDFSVAKILAVKTFGEAWAAAGGDSFKTEGKNLGNGLVIMDKYCDHYARDLHIFRPEMVEVAQYLPMPNGTFLNLVLDRVYISDDTILFVDTKTTGKSISEYYWKGYENSFQLSTYHYIVNQFYGHCDGIQLDAIQVPFKTEQSFQRRTWQLSPMQIEDWLRTYLDATSRIMEKLQGDKETMANRFTCSPTACSSYGGCPYLQICKYGFDHPAIKELFTLGESEND